MTVRGPELRVSLIAINKEKQVLLKKSPDRWGKLLTVPGRKIEREDGVQTLKDLVDDLGLTLLSEPVFLAPPKYSKYPNQFKGTPTFFVFHEYRCLVEGTTNQGEFYSLYEVLHENEEYRAKPYVEGVNTSLLVEDITFDVLEKNVKKTIEENDYPK